MVKGNNSSKADGSEGIVHVVIQKKGCEGTTLCVRSCVINYQDAKLKCPCPNCPCSSMYKYMVPLPCNIEKGDKIIQSCFYNLDCGELQSIKLVDLNKLVEPKDCCLQFLACKWKDKSVLQKCIGIEKEQENVQGYIEKYSKEITLLTLNDLSKQLKKLKLFGTEQVSSDSRAKLVELQRNGKNEDWMLKNVEKSKVLDPCGLLYLGKSKHKVKPIGSYWEENGKIFFNLFCEAGSPSGDEQKLLEDKDVPQDCFGSSSGDEQLKLLEDDNVPQDCDSPSLKEVQTADKTEKMSTTLPRHSLGKQAVDPKSDLQLRIMQDFIKKMGWKRKANHGQGYCMLYSFLDSFEKTESQLDLKGLCALIAKELSDNFDIYKPFVSKDTEPEKELLNYIASGDYNADIVDLIWNLLANATNTSIDVFYFNGQTMTNHHIAPVNGSSKRTISVLNHGEHYEALLKDATIIDQSEVDDKENLNSGQPPTNGLKKIAQATCDGNDSDNATSRLTASNQDNTQVKKLPFPEEVDTAKSSQTARNNLSENIDRSKKEILPGEVSSSSSQAEDHQMVSAQGLTSGTTADDQVRQLKEKRKNLKSEKYESHVRRDEKVNEPHGKLQDICTVSETRGRVLDLMDSRPFADDRVQKRHESIVNYIYCEAVEEIYNRPYEEKKEEEGANSADD